MENRAGVGERLTYSPWDDAATRYPRWIIHLTDLRGLHELMCWDSRVILLDHERTKVERRCDLAHALGHLDLEHRGDTFNRKHEESADRHASRLLISVSSLADAVQWSRDPREVAEALHVDVRTVMARMRSLHPAERGVIGRRLAEREHAA